MRRRLVRDSSIFLAGKVLVVRNDLADFAPPLAESRLGLRGGQP